MFHFLTRTDNACEIRFSSFSVVGPIEPNLEYCNYAKQSNISNISNKSCERVCGWEASFRDRNPSTRKADRCSFTAMSGTFLSIRLSERSGFYEHFASGCNVREILHDRSEEFNLQQKAQNTWCHSGRNWQGINKRLWKI